jgi:hypothetical protein
MSAFSPTIINNTTPAVSVVGGNVTYGELRQSLGDYVYLVESVYLYSTNIQQIGGVVKFQIYNVDGNKGVESLTPTIDPYQDQNSLFYNVRERDVILNGQSNFNFNLLPNVYLKLEFFTNRVAKKDALDIMYPNNFKTLESAMGKYTFFEDWTPKL